MKIYDPKKVVYKPEEDSDPRINAICEIILEYASGNYKNSLKPSPQNDRIDQIIAGINMLGEELEASTISKDYLQSIYKGIIDLFFIIDTDNLILDCNHVVCNVLGYSKMELTERNISKIFYNPDPKNNNFLKELDEELFAKGYVFDNKSKFLAKNGKIYSMSCSWSLIYNRNKRLTGKLLFAKDITEIEEMSARLIESEEKFRSIFESSKDAIYISKRDGTIVDMNPAGLEMLGYTKHDIGSINAKETYKNPQDRITVQREIITSGSIKNYEVTLIRKNKQAFTGLISATTILDSNKEIIGYRGIIRDITDLKKRESEILNAIVSAQEGERRRIAKDLHDGLSQQLSALNLYLSSIKDYFKNIPNSKQEAFKSTREIVSSAIRELKTISHNLMPIELENYGLIPAVKNFCNNININEELIIEINYNKENFKLPDHISIAIYRVIQEFMQNTLKHSKAKKVKITFEKLNQSINISLEDNGKGFKYNPTNKKYGMGLKNVITRISSIKGTISIKSKIGKGTTYNISIPLQLSKN